MQSEHYFAPPSAAAGFLTDIFSNGGAGKESYAVLLSGGRSISPVLTAVERIDSGLLAKCRFYLTDERIGSDFNQEMLRERLFRKLCAGGTVREEQLVFPDINLPPEQGAKEYEKLLPAFDLAFVGVGEDGHVCSLFPGHPALDSASKVEVVRNSPKPPPTRITLTFRAFADTTVIVLLFFGTSKKAAFVQFHNSDSFYTCPAAYFKRAETLYIIHDQEGVA
jgi:6-phosphogluconolactonase